MEKLRSTITTTTSLAISTTIFNRAYLECAWKQRSQLTDYERNGFSQYFYLTVTGHLEASMSELIEHRQMFIRTMASPLKDTSVENSFLPIYESLKGVLGHFGRKVDKAALESLIELFQDIFAIKLKDVLGDELHKDLKALSSLRNVFAHGRDLQYRFDQTVDNRLILEETPLQPPAHRLLAAGILKNLNFNRHTYHELQTALYSDSAMLYFLNAAQEIESKLKELLVSPLETDIPLMVSLPILLG